MNNDELIKDQPVNNEGELPLAETPVLTPWQEERRKYLAEHDPEGLAALEDSLQSEADSAAPEQVKLTTVPPVEPKPATAAVVVEAEAEAEASVKPHIKPLKDLPKSKSFADKLPKMKETRQKRLHQRLVLLLGGFGTATLLTLYYVSPFSYLGQIEVVGNTHVSDESIATATELTHDDRIWKARFAKGTVGKIKESNPRIKAVKVNVTHVNHLKLTIDEYAEVAYIKDNKTLHPVLESGKILKETSKEADPSFPVLVGFEEGTKLDDLLAHYQKVDQAVRTEVEQVENTPSAHNPYLVTFSLKDGNKILASTKDYYTKINFYPSVAAEMTAKGVVDMEAGIFSSTYEALEKATTDSSDGSSAETE